MAALEEAVGLEEAPARLETLVTTENQRAPWLVEFKDPSQTRSAWETWDAATATERKKAATWIRAWEADPESQIKYVKECMGCLTPIIQASFDGDRAVPRLRRWAA